MFSDMTIITVDLANLELGAINGFAELNPFFWLALHDYWICLLVDLGIPRLPAGLHELICPTDFLGEPTDYSVIPINEPPFIHVPTGLQLGIVASYTQLNERGLLHADN